MSVLVVFDDPNSGCSPVINGRNEGGADITFARKSGRSEEIYATLVDYEPGPSPVDYQTPEAVFTGEARRTIGALECPMNVDARRFHPSTVTSLGCGGTLILEFLEPDGTRSLILENEKITVGELSASCETLPTQNSNDAYYAMTCRLESQESWEILQDEDTRDERCEILGGPFESTRTLEVL